MIIVNGDLGPNMPLAKDVPLGSGDFWLFTIRDLGLLKLYGQFKRAWNASILTDPVRWGWGSFCVKNTLEIRPADGGEFPLNVDGSTMPCREAARFRIIDQIHLLTR